MDGPDFCDSKLGSIMPRRVCQKILVKTSKTEKEDVKQEMYTLKCVIRSIS